MDRRPPKWVREVTPWGTSLALHGLMLLLLALIFYGRSGRDGREPRSIEANTLLASQLIDDLTSVAPAERAGDPFTTIASVEPPSLALDASRLDAERINLPKLPPNVKLADGLRLDPIDSRPELGLDGPGRHVGGRVAPFSGRQGEAKARLVRREGGTVESEKAVERGLDWLARHQRPDGGWALDISPMCQGAGCPRTPASESDTAATGLAVLPFLGAGLNHLEPSRYQANIKRGLSWLMAHQGRDGDLFTGGMPISHFYSHAIASMALCEAYGISRDKRLRDPSQRALNFIVRSQNLADGGWRYRPGMEGDTSVFGWQIFALRSGRLADLSVSKPTILRCRTYLDLAAADEFQATYSYLPGREVSAVMTAEGLLGRQILGWGRDYPPLVKGAAKVAANLEESTDRNIYYWYYATQLLHNLQGPAWERWNLKVREGLVATQADGDGCDRGSWSPLDPQPDRWGKAAGRLFETSLSILTLEVYYRYLPLYRPREDQQPDADESDPADPAKPVPQAEAGSAPAAAR